MGQQSDGSVSAVIKVEAEKEEEVSLMGIQSLLQDPGDPSCFSPVS